MPAVPPVIRVFLYGTLRPGSTNPHALFLSSRCSSLGKAKLRGRLFRMGPQWVAVHEPNGKNEVTGEVFLLPDRNGEQVLESLDRYEGIGSGLPGPAVFRREMVTVELADGSRVECWTWLFSLPVHGLTEIPGGDALKG